MLPPDEVAAMTGHPVGGVCPFGLAQPLAVYADVRLRDFDTVLPAAGSTHNAVRVTGSYTAAFVNGLAWNLLNLTIVLVLWRRTRRASVG